MSSKLVIQALTEAIRAQRCVAIHYHDQRQIRVIEPHVLYEDEEGRLVVDAYQTRGYSAAGRPPPFWRPFRIKKIAVATVLDESFTVRTREGFNPQMPKYRNGLQAMVDSDAGAKPARGKQRVPAAAPVVRSGPPSVAPRAQPSTPPTEDMGPPMPGSKGQF